VRRVLVALAFVVAVLLPAAPAFAHNQLIATRPAAGAKLAEPPAAVTLTFVQPLNPRFTTIVVSDAARRVVPAGAPVVDGGRGTVSFAAPPGNGGYTVAYRIVSVDGHVVQGSYQFTVADPALPAAAAVPVAAAPSPNHRGVLIGVVVAVVLLCAGAAYLWIRRSTSTASRRTPSGTPR
jgi:copper resistance protein C